MQKRYLTKTLLLTFLIFSFLSSFAENYVTQQDLNVHSGAGASYALLGVIITGSTIDVEEINGNWARIKYEEQTAYVSTKFISKTTSTSQSLSLSENSSSKSSASSSRVAFYVIGAIIIILGIRFVMTRSSELLGVKGEQDYKYKCTKCGRYSTRRGHMYKCNSGEHEWFQM